MDREEENKQSSRRTPFFRLDQVDADYALAITLQEQERAFTMLSTIESDSEEDEGDAAASSNNDNIVDDDDADFFVSGAIEAEIDLFRGEDSNTDEEMDVDDDDEDDDDDDDLDIDPDELSYEELIALEEFIGEEKRGLSINEIPKCLSPCTGDNKSVDRKTGIDRCVICQVEYEEGEELVALPCEHPYHSDCISKWLQIKKICPICSTEISPPEIAKTYT